MKPLRQQGRKSPRLPKYDYTRAGMYFVTICTYQREHLFGEIMDNCMVLNTWGQLALICWQPIPEHFAMVELDEYIVMPNHVHGIIHILEANLASFVGARHASPLPDTTPPESSSNKPVALSTIIGSYKSAVTRRINQLRETPSARVWQCSYHDHIIHTEKALNHIRQYVRQNPALWEHDQFYL